MQSNLEYQGQRSESIDKSDTESIDSDPSEATDIPIVAPIDTTAVADKDQQTQDQHAKDQHAELSAHSRFDFHQHQLDTEDLVRRLQVIKADLAKISPRWTRSGDATRSFTASESKDEESVCPPANKNPHCTP
ncbi:Uncharacterized protein Rs2_29090 [Raphanus sativus]|nr:Uncharacterized protein Rs2_29090 [Raphanus sativus]